MLPIPSSLSLQCLILYLYPILQPLHYQDDSHHLLKMISLLPPLTHKIYSLDVELPWPMLYGILERNKFSHPEQETLVSCTNLKKLKIKYSHPFPRLCVHACNQVNNCIPKWGEHLHEATVSIYIATFSSYIFLYLFLLQLFRVYSYLLIKNIFLGILLRVTTCSSFRLSKPRCRSKGSPSGTLPAERIAIGC